MKPALFLGACALVAAGCCAREPSRARLWNPAPLAAPAPAPAPPPIACADPRSVADILARHARAFGGKDAVRAELPLTFRGEIEVGWAAGRFEVLVAPDRFRVAAEVHGVRTVTGMDEHGVFERAEIGVTQRLGPDESIDTLPWLWRRGYLDPAAASRATKDCAAPGEIALVYPLAELGTPTLRFSEADARLLGARWRESTGKLAEWSLAFGEPDAAGVRWPAAQERTSAGEDVVKLLVRAREPGAHCALVPGAGADPCGPPADAFSIRWPSDAAVTLPLSFMHGELFVRAHIGKDEMGALLDSGAGLTALDPQWKAAASFKPAMTIEGEGATQHVLLGLGVLPQVDVGPLLLSRVPAVTVPIPGLENMGADRPDLVLGYSLFAAAAVRIDYAHGKLTLARPGTALAGAAAVPIGFRQIAGAILVDAAIDGRRGSFQLDTGDSGGFDAYASWAAPNGFPGDRPQVTLHGQFGAGTAETAETLFRYRRAELGPLAIDRGSSRISPPKPDLVAGLIGNAALARCQALTLDVSRRTLWIEPPCDRKVPVNRAGFAPLFRPEPKDPQHPWLVGALLPGGPAAAAGLRDGDRLLRVGAWQAGADLKPIEAELDKPAGARVAVEVARDRARLPVELRLAEPAGK